MLFQSISPLTALTVVLVLSSTVLAGNYTLRDEITGRQFLDRFWFWFYNDPTHGMSTMSISSLLLPIGWHTSTQTITL